MEHNIIRGIRGGLNDIGNMPENSHSKIVRICQINEWLAF